MSPPKVIARALPQKLRNRTAYLFLLSLPVAILLYALPTLYDDYNYPQCGHIILVSAPHQGDEWFSRGAESCTLNEVTPWSGNNISVGEALHHLNKKSLKILPGAFDKHAADLRTFFRHAKATGTKVFVLKRLIPEAWNDVPKVERRVIGDVEDYKELNKKYFNGIKSMLREIGYPWDELLYDDISEQRLIHGKQNDCYIRNCGY